MVFPSATNVSLICNTFSGWQPNENIVGAVQMSCTPLPDGTECTTYAANIFTVEGGTPAYTWSVSSGSLPPGLTMDPATGAITGTPTAVGEFQLSVTVVDSTQPALTATQAQTVTIAACQVATTVPPTTVPPTTAPPAVVPPTVAPPGAVPTTVPILPGTLPATGSGNSVLLLSGLALLALGAVAVIVASRRRINHT